MGKRTGGLTGVSRFARELFGSPPQAKDDESTKIVESPPILEEATPSAKNGRPPDRSPGRPAKRRKIRREKLPDYFEAGKYDATGLVPHYRNASQVPDHLKKYFSQRKRYFSLYDQGCLLDEEGWYSVTPERVAEQIAERCRCDTVLDAFCGVGGNAIAFAKTCERVIAIDNSPIRLALARHNAAIYGVADRIEFILADYISFAHSYLSIPSQRQTRKIDVVFLSPPWGGPSYLSGPGTPDGAPATPAAEAQTAEQAPAEATYPEYSLASIQPIHGAEIFQLSRQISPNVAYFLPRNTRLEEISALLTNEEKTRKGKAPDKGDGSHEMVEVEEEWMGTKLKALTCYFGGLAAGQEHLY